MITLTRKIINYVLSLQLNHSPYHVLCRGRSNPDVWLEWLHEGVGAIGAEFVFSLQPEVGPLSPVLRRRSLPLPLLGSLAPFFPRSGRSWPTGPGTESGARSWASRVALGNH